MNLVAYLYQLLGLLPVGRLWSRSEDTLLSQLMAAFADGAARFDAKLIALLEEADPREANELVGAWERMIGLPDSCTLISPILEDRRAAIWQKLTQTGGQTAAYFEGIAARLGCLISIQEFPRFTAGSYCGMPVYGDAWKSVWQVTVLTAPDGTAALECVLRRVKPAHTALIFSYAEGVYPSFYYDFTSGD